MLVRRRVWIIVSLIWFVVGWWLFENTTTIDQPVSMGSPHARILDVIGQVAAVMFLPPLGAMGTAFLVKVVGRRLDSWRAAYVSFKLRHDLPHEPLSPKGFAHPDIDQADKFTVLPAVFPVVAALAVGTAGSFDPMLSPLYLLFGVVGAVVWLIAVIIQVTTAVRRRQWHLVVSILLIVTYVWPMTRILLQTGDYIHLAIVYPSYASKIADAKNPTASLNFGWGGTGFAGSGNSERILTYDPLNRLASEIGERPVPDQTTMWRSVRHLAGPFYLVELDW